MIALLAGENILYALCATSGATIYANVQGELVPIGGGPPQPISNATITLTSSYSVVYQPPAGYMALISELVFTNYSATAGSVACVISVASAGANFAPWGSPYGTIPARGVARFGSDGWKTYTQYGVRTTNIPGYSLFLNQACQAQSGNAAITASATVWTHGGRCVFKWSATGYTSTVGAYAFYLVLDGTNVYQTAQSLMFLNTVSAHTAFPTAIYDAGVLAPGSHSAYLLTSPGLVTDSNDHCWADMTEWPI